MCHYICVSKICYQLQSCVAACAPITILITFISKSKVINLLLLPCLLQTMIWFFIYAKMFEIILIALHTLNCNWTKRNWKKDSFWLKSGNSDKKETKNQLNLRVQRKEDGILKTELAILQKRTKENNFILYLRFKHLKSTVFVETLSYVKQWKMEWMIRLISAVSCRHVKAGSVFFPLHCSFKRRKGNTPCFVWA